MAYAQRWKNSVIWRSHTGLGQARVQDTAQVNREGRPMFEWSLYIRPSKAEPWEDSHIVAQGSDLAGPTIGPEPSETDMLATLAAFVSAWKEARDYQQRTGCESDNADLFPGSAAPWADIYAEDFSLWGIDHEEARKR